MFRLDPDHVYRAESLEQFPWLEHGFGTRRTNGWPDYSRLVAPKQIHSNRILLVPPDPRTGETARLGEGDALVSAQTQVLSGIRTADCLPILLVDARTRTVGAIHAGWRGTVSEVTPLAVEAMLRQFGTRPADIWAAIGPGIGPCCFEIGPDVAVQFRPWFPERNDLEQRTNADLAETNRRQLTSAGVPASQIVLSGLCTVCRADDFHSYRRDKEKAGRMLSVIGVR